MCVQSYQGERLTAQKELKFHFAVNFELAYIDLHVDVAQSYLIAECRPSIITVRTT